MDSAVIPVVARAVLDDDPMRVVASQLSSEEENLLDFLDEQLNSYKIGRFCPKRKEPQKESIVSQLKGFNADYRAGKRQSVEFLYEKYWDAFFENGLIEGSTNGRLAKTLLQCMTKIIEFTLQARPYSGVRSRLLERILKRCSTHSYSNQFNSKVIKDGINHFSYEITSSVFPKHITVETPHLMVIYIDALQTAINKHIDYFGLLYHWMKTMCGDLIKIHNEQERKFTDEYIEFINYIITDFNTRVISPWNQGCFFSLSKKDRIGLIAHGRVMSASRYQELMDSDSCETTLQVYQTQSDDIMPEEAKVAESGGIKAVVSSCSKPLTGVVVPTEPEEAIALHEQCSAHDSAGKGHSSGVELVEMSVRSPSPR